MGTSEIEPDWKRRERERVERRAAKEQQHQFPNGTVSVRMHKRKRLTLVADRGAFGELLVERLEQLEHENAVLRRKLSEARALLRGDTHGD